MFSLPCFPGSSVVSLVDPKSMLASFEFMHSQDIYHLLKHVPYCGMTRDKRQKFLLDLYALHRLREQNFLARLGFPLEQNP